MKGWRPQDIPDDILGRPTFDVPMPDNREVWDLCQQAMDIYMADPQDVVSPMMQGRVMVIWPMPHRHEQRCFRA